MSSDVPQCRQGAVPALTVALWRDREKSLSADLAWHALPGQIPAPRQSGGAASPLHPHTHSPADRPVLWAGQKYMVITICRVQGGGDGLTQPGYNLRRVFWNQAASEMLFSPTCALQFTPCLLLWMGGSERSCQFVSFSEPTALMGCHCDPAALSALHDYCV